MPILIVSTIRCLKCNVEMEEEDSTQIFICTNCGAKVIIDEIVEDWCDE